MTGHFSYRIVDLRVFCCNFAIFSGVTVGLSLGKLSVSGL